MWDLFRESNTRERNTMKATSLLKTVKSIHPTLTVSLLTVLILITTLNGTTHAVPPVFNPNTETVYIAEDTPLLRTIPHVRATGTGLIYTIADADDGDDGDSTFFLLDKETGRLQLNKTVDFEDPKDTGGTNEYVVMITAAEVDSPNSKDTLTLTIIVENVNEAPMFTDEEMEEDDLPGLQIKTRTVAENTQAGQDINTDDLVMAMDPDNPDGSSTGDTNPDTPRRDVLIYTLTGTDARYFDIDPNSGQLMTKTVLDFEAPMDAGGTPRDNYYIVTVRATDSASGGLSSQVTVTIMVTDLNEAPEFPDPTANLSVPENAPAGTTVGTPITATDPEGDTVTYSVTDENFEIESDGQLKTTKGLDHEAMGSHVISVTATSDDGDDNDGTSNTNSIVVTITVTDANDPPMFADDTTTRTVAENQRAGPFGTAVPADDDDEDDYALTYGIADVPGKNHARLFTIHPSTGRLSTRNPLDFEDEDYPTDGYMVRVTVSDRKDDAGDTDTAVDDTIDVTITVGNVNEPPAFGAATASNLYFYESTTRTTVYDPDGVLIAMDPDAADTPVYGSTPGGPDGAEFTLSAGVLTAPSKDFEADKHTYTVIATVSDSATPPLSDTIILTIHLRDVADGDGVINGPPMFVDENGEDLGEATFSVQENASSLFIGRVRATDPDNDTLTYSVGTTGDDLLFSVDNTGELYSKEPLNYEAAGDDGSYTVTVTATDSTSPEDTVDVIINVINVNEAPVFGTLEIPIMRATRTVEENTIAGEEINVNTPVSAVDPESDPLTYTLTGANAALFDIDYSGDTGGQLKTRAPLDYETKSTYMVTVVASDGELKTEIPVEIIVTGVNEKPMFTDGERITIEMPEDISMMANIGMMPGMMPVAATDPEMHTLTYDIDSDPTTSPDADKFEIREEYGQLYYMLDTDLDFEEGVPFYQIKVTVSDRLDDAGGEDSADDDEIIVIIKVTDVNEPPMFMDEMVTHEVPENTMEGYPTNGLIIATDPERDAVTYHRAWPAAAPVGSCWTTEVSSYTSSRRKRVTTIGWSGSGRRRRRSSTCRSGCRMNRMNRMKENRSGRAC